jgi:TatD DNase family protein
MKKLESLIQRKVLFDSHAHLVDNTPTELEELVNQAKKNNVYGIVNVSTDIQSANDVESQLAKADLKDYVLCGVGLHPELLIPGMYSALGDNMVDVMRQIKNVLQDYASNVELKIFDLIGECGIDYYWIDRVGLDKQSTSSCKRAQMDLFNFQLELAKQNDLFVSIHTRDSFEQTLMLVEKIGHAKVIFHSFTGDYSQLIKIVDKGYYLGINGILTYSSAVELRTGLQKFIGKTSNPDISTFYDKHVLFETDSPLLRPSNANTKNNTPANVKKIFDFACKLVK